MSRASSGKSKSPRRSRVASPNLTGRPSFSNSGQETFGFARTADYDSRSRRATCAKLSYESCALRLLAVLSAYVGSP